MRSLVKMAKLSRVILIDKMGKNKSLLQKLDANRVSGLSPTRAAVHAKSSAPKHAGGPAPLGVGSGLIRRIPAVIRASAAGTGRIGSGWIAHKVRQPKNV